jgi:altronate dehydratase large subunit
MLDYTFLGYERENGEVGIRNHVLILPLQRDLSILARKISDHVKGTRPFIHLGESGRTAYDREIIYRTTVGLGCNPNVASVMILTKSRDTGYPELKLNRILSEIEKTNKRIEVILVGDEGGYYNSLGKGVELARDMVLEASKCRRKEFDLSKVSLSVKCGMSDNTSGISGNPAVGNAFDKIVQAGGKAFFSETTEVIGAEHLLVERCKNKEVADKLLKAVKETEEKALSTGEDIRTINPIPQNIAGGISSLEEKSLGAIVKSGSSTIQDVLEYSQRPEEPGLYFVDGWMSGFTMPVGYAASGAQLMIFQMGGQGLTGEKPPMSTIDSGVVIPIMYVTGNYSTYQRAKDNMDFDASGVYMNNLSIDEVGDKLLHTVLDIYSGTSTKVETLNYEDPVELDFQGPNF